MSNELATSKDVLVRNLVAYDIEYFVEFIRHSDAAKIALATMMMEGFIGYNHWSEEELRKECVRRDIFVKV